MFRKTICLLAIVIGASYYQVQENKQHESIEELYQQCLIWEE